MKKVIEVLTAISTILIATGEVLKQVNALKDKLQDTSKEGVKKDSK